MKRYSLAHCPPDAWMSEDKEGGYVLLDDMMKSRPHFCATDGRGFSLEWVSGDKEVRVYVSTTNHPAASYIYWSNEGADGLKHFSSGHEIEVTLMEVFGEEE